MNSDVTDTFTFELWFCYMHFLILFLAFIQKIRLISFHFFQKLIKGGVGIRAGGLENFSKINKLGGTIIRYSRVGGIVHLA